MEVNHVSKKIRQVYSVIGIGINLVPAADIRGCSDSSNDGGSGGNIYAGKLVNADLSKEFTAQEVADAIRDGFSNTGIDVSEMIATSNAVKAYSIEYYTKNINGELIIVSGLVAFPSPADSEYPVVQYHSWHPVQQSGCTVQPG